MKKLLAYLLVGILIHNSLVFPINVASIKSAAVQKKEQFLHYWNCATTKNPAKYQCTNETISRGRRWLLQTSLTVLAVILAAIGVKKVTRDKLAKIKEEQMQKEFEASELKRNYDAINAQIAYAGTMKPWLVAGRVKDLIAQKEALKAKIKEQFPQQYERLKQ